MGLNDDELPAEIVVERANGAPPFRYRLRPYTPRRRGAPAGHGWVRDDPRAEVGAEARDLLDEIARLRSIVARLGGTP